MKKYIQVLRDYYMINQKNETARYQNKNLLDFYFDEGSYAQNIINPLDLLYFRETLKLNNETK